MSDDSSTVLSSQGFDGAPNAEDQPYRDLVGTLRARSAIGELTLDTALELIKRYINPSTDIVAQNGYTFVYTMNEYHLSLKELRTLVIDSLRISLSQGNLTNARNIFTSLGANPNDFLNFYSSAVQIRDRETFNNNATQYFSYIHNDEVL